MSKHTPDTSPYLTLYLHWLVLLDEVLYSVEMDFVTLGHMLHLSYLLPYSQQILFVFRHFSLVLLHILCPMDLLH